jgi:uncharacterized protein YggE
LVALTLAGCAQLGALPTLAAGSERAAVAGGGGGAVVTAQGQFVEGLVAVGTGTSSAEPEVAQIPLGVELRGDDPAALVDEGAQKIDRITDAAREQGVADEDIRTIGYNLWVETIHDPDTGQPTGDVVYHLSHQVQVKVRDLNNVGNLLAGAVNAGANSISGVNFSVEDPQALVEEARQAALKDAAARAQQMADGLGIAIGKPVLVMETSGVVPVTLERGIGGGGGGMAEVAAPSLSPGSFSVSVSVQVVYKIQ